MFFRGCCFPPMSTPCLESMAKVVSWIKRCCDLAHRSPKALQCNRSVSNFINGSTDSPPAAKPSGCLSPLQPTEAPSIPTQPHPLHPFQAVRCRVLTNPFSHKHHLFHSMKETSKRQELRKSDFMLVLVASNYRSNKIT